MSEADAAMDALEGPVWESGDKTLSLTRTQYESVRARMEKKFNVSIASLLLCSENIWCCNGYTCATAMAIEAPIDGFEPTRTPTARQPFCVKCGHFRILPK